MAGTNKGPGNIRDKTEHLASEAKESAKETAATVGQKASELASAVGEKARETASNLGHKAQEYASSAAGAAGARTDDALAAAGQGMSSLAGTIRQRAPQEGMLGTAAEYVAGGLEAGGDYLTEHGVRDIGEDVSRLVRQHPLPSLLVVFGLGYMFGRVLRR